MSIVIVVNNPDRWELDIDGVALVSARDYLTDPLYSDMRGAIVFNLCRSYAYQSLGYYVSLLAEARGHRPKPSIATVQDMKLQAIAREVSDDLGELTRQCFAQIRSKQFVLSIYFGRSLAKRYRKLALQLFNQFQAPLLRARFTRHEEGWDLASIGPIPANEIPDSHRPFVVEAATEYFANRRFSPRRLKQPPYELAILLDQSDPHPPSNKRAVRLFERLAVSVGLGVERITKDDYGRIAEFDALFIRTTTAVNHYTYNFASRGAAAGLAVVDDPQSIVRCANKVYLHELMERCGIRTPKTLIVHQGNVDSVAGELGLPCVLKQPDSSFSQGVMRVDDRVSLESKLHLLLEMSDLVLAQQYLPTEYDWRVGVFDKKPLFVCRYYMAPKHWQIYKHGSGAEPDVGKVETLAVEQAPQQVVRTALRAANLIGDGLYGVDLKQSGNKLYVIEINDNPNIDRGFEDRALGKELYLRILRGFVERIERLKAPVGSAAAMSGERLRLFDAYGIELEYMIVDRETLDVRPISDRLLVDAAGEVTGDVELGEISWSNELVLHVLEMKCSEPAAALEPLPTHFQRGVARANEVLAPLGARLLPTAMHPWMDPFAEMRLWPHDYNVVYQTFDRIFDCRGHGWANLQSMHVNLPFGSDERRDDEFARLHAAIRLVLPILPALAASSPVMDGVLTGIADNRLEVYRKNSARIPAIAGRVVPEPVFTRRDYEEQVLGRIYADVAPHDPEGILRHEWCNARGAIARFDRSAIEIRVLDLQECPLADLSIAALVASVVEALTRERWVDLARQQTWQVEPLAKLFLGCVAQGERSVIDDAAYLALFDFGGARATAGELWRHLRERVWTSGAPRERAFGGAVDVMLREGTLSSRIARALGPGPSRGALRAMYGELADGLAAGRMFVP